MYDKAKTLLLERLLRLNEKSEMHEEEGGHAFQTKSNSHFNMIFYCEENFARTTANKLKTDDREI